MSTLTSAIRRAVEQAGLPVALVEVGKIGDRRTWKATLKDNATVEQRATAQAIVDAFYSASVKAPRWVNLEDALDRLTDQEWTALQTAIANNVRMARWYERAKMRGPIDLEDVEVKPALAAVVATGLFTKQRLSAILAAAVE